MGRRNFSDIVQRRLTCVFPSSRSPLAFSVSKAARHLRQPRAPTEPLCDSRSGQRFYRRTSSRWQPAKGRLAARRSWLRRRLVQRNVESQRDTRQHPRPKTAEATGEVRQASLQTAQPPLSGHCFALPCRAVIRNHVRQVEGSATGRDPVRQMPKGLPSAIALAASSLTVYEP